MNEKVKVFFMKLIFWSIIIFIIAGIVFYEFQNRQTTNELIEKGVITLGRTVFFKESSGDNPARVRYVYYYKGQPYKVERDTYRDFEKGDYVYIILNPEEPERGYHVSQRQVDEGDTVLNLIHNHLNLSDAEIGKLVPGDIYLYESVSY